MAVPQLIISIVLTLILAFFLYQYAKKKITGTDIWDQINSNTDTNDEGGTPDDPAIDWKNALDNDAQTYALKTWCSAKGYDYDPVQDACIYTETSCNNDSNPHYSPCDTTSDPNCVDPPSYLEWHTSSGSGSGASNDLNNGHCVAVNKAVFFKNEFCGKEGLPWYPGSLQCTTDGYCSLPSDLSGPDIPTCILTDDYCFNKGEEYSSAGQGDCSITDYQNIAEALAGRTIVRRTKIVAENMIKECTNDIFSVNCAAAIGTLAVFGQDIWYSTEAKIAQTLLENVQEQCNGDIYSSDTKFVGCVNSILNFYPSVWIAENGIKFIDQMLTGLFGWAGMPSGVLERGVAYVVQGGIIAAHAIFHAGEVAVYAMDHGLTEACQAFKRMGSPLSLVGDGLQLFQTGCQTIVKFGVKAAKVIMVMGSIAIQFLTQTLAPLALEVLNSVVGAVLHPREFIANLANLGAQLFTDPKQFCDTVKNAISSLAGVTKNMVKSFINGIAKAASAFKGVLESFASALENLAVEIGNDIANFAEDVASDLDPANWF